MNRFTSEAFFVPDRGLFDRFIGEQVRQGADFVVNLGAGAYRMSWPESLTRVEVNLTHRLVYSMGGTHQRFYRLTKESPIRVRLFPNSFLNRWSTFRELIELQTHAIYLFNAISA